MWRRPISPMKIQICPHFLQTAVFTAIWVRDYQLWRTCNTVYWPINYSFQRNNSDSSDYSVHRKCNCFIADAADLVFWCSTDCFNRNRRKEIFKEKNAIGCNFSKKAYIRYVKSHFLTANQRAYD